MAKRHRYALRARISEPQIRQIVWLFALDLDATQIIALSGLNRNTSNRYLHGIRERIAVHILSCAHGPGAIRIKHSKHGSMYRMFMVVFPLFVWLVNYKSGSFLCRGY